MVGLELQLEHADGSTTTVRTGPGAAAGWRGYDATAAYGPGRSEGPNAVCYTAPQVRGPEAAGPGTTPQQLLRRLKPCPEAADLGHHAPAAAPAPS